MLELYQLTAHALRDLIRKKETSAVEITKSILKRIDKVEPTINSYITIVAENALKKAEDIDKKIAAQEQVSDLAGIPMALKDNICTQDILTTCASRMLYNFEPPYNATVTNRLNDAGAILLGKANMDEFAMGSSTENSYFVKTKNPYDIERVPGGSSGGSAAAVASDEAVFSLGSDTGGSIRQPASFCGITGMKPTYGAVSRFGLIAFASSLEQIGPMTKDVTDCALVLNTICGHDVRDSTSINRTYPDYRDFFVNNVKGLKIGIPEEYFKEGISEEVKQAILKALEVYKALGAEYEEFSLPLTEYALPAYYLISSAEASSNLARYDGIRYGYRCEKFNNLDELYYQTRSNGFGKEVKRRIMLGTYSLSAGYYDAYYKKAQQARTLIRKSFEEVFEKYDMIITPTAPTTAFKLKEKTIDPLKMYAGDMYTVAANITGLPAMVIPCGLDSNGLPIGMQLMSKAFNEPILLQAAYTFEQNTEYHKNRPNL